jgi:hypothetical protein
MALAESIDAYIAFGGGILATYYGWRPVPTGPKHLEWLAWKACWGRLLRIAGILLIVISLIRILAESF